MKSINEKLRCLLNFALPFGLLGALLWWGAEIQPAFAQAAQAGTPADVPILLLGAETPPHVQGGAASEEFDEAVFRALVRTSILLVKQGNYAQAIVLLEPYRAKDDFSMLHALGIAYVRTERNEEAYDTLLRAHQLNPNEAGPLLPAALACARMAKRCDAYRQLALEYMARGGKFVRFADKIANFQPVALVNKSKEH
jgi:tetratricopeptide (TPR) repeat protein